MKNQSEITRGPIEIGAFKELYHRYNFTFDWNYSRLSDGSRTTEFRGKNGDLIGILNNNTGKARVQLNKLETFDLPYLLTQLGADWDYELKENDKKCIEVMNSVGDDMISKRFWKKMTGGNL